MNKAGRELFSAQKGADGLAIVVRPVIDQLKSLLNNWASLSDSYPDFAALYVLSSFKMIAA